MSTKLRIAACQMAVGKDKAANVATALKMIAAAKATHQAQVVVLPECFNCPYGTKYFRDYAEPIPAVGTTVAGAAPSSDCGSSVLSMANAAKEHGVWLVAGSIPEVAGGDIYNASMTFSPDGTLCGLHRKIHLFKLNTDTVKFDESEVLTAGDAPTVVPTPHGKIGVGICFDIRFPQLSMFYQTAGTSLLVYPGAFNMVTGPAHWELSARARAVDAQQFVCLCSPARDTSAEYVAYGHTMIVDPWGNVVAKAVEGEEAIVAAEVDMAQCVDIRSKLPTMAGTRNDLYSLSWKE
jgi:nitrilase